MAEPTHREILDTINDLKHVVEALAKDVAETREVVKAWAVVRGGGQAVIMLGKVIAGIGVIVVGIKVAIVWLSGHGAA